MFDRKFLIKSQISNSNEVFIHSDPFWILRCKSRKPKKSCLLRTPQSSRGSNLEVKNKSPLKIGAAQAFAVLRPLSCVSPRVGNSTGSNDLHQGVILVMRDIFLVAWQFAAPIIILVAEGVLLPRACQDSQPSDHQVATSFVLIYIGQACY
jgi:hypothetical protein